MEQIASGAFESFPDPRTVVYPVSTMGAPLVAGGVDYLPTDIEHQHKVGICTAISRVQLRQKQTGKKYSPDFQYLLQKKFYDGNTQEGSSILHANKVAKKIGFLPASLWTYTTESDRYLPYYDYMAKLEAIPISEIVRLAGSPDENGEFSGGLCVDKIAGYANVNVLDAQAMAKAIDDSIGQAGILCRYNVGEDWWVPSWNAQDIDPLRPPRNPTSGHAIIMSKYDYSVPLQQKLANTWGISWCLGGTAHVNWSNYKPTEAWTDLLVAPVIAPVLFTKTLSMGMRDAQVLLLQQRLNKDGFTLATTGPGSAGNETDYFGQLTLNALERFQTANGLPGTGLCGDLTRAVLNKL